MTSHPNLDQLNSEELRSLAAQLIQRIETMDKQITHHKSVNENLADLALDGFAQESRGQALVQSRPFL